MFRACAPLIRNPCLGGFGEQYRNRVFTVTSFYLCDDLIGTRSQSASHSSIMSEGVLETGVHSLVFSMVRHLCMFRHRMLFSQRADADAACPYVLLLCTTPSGRGQMTIGLVVLSLDEPCDCVVLHPVYCAVRVVFSHRYACGSQSASQLPDCCYRNSYGPHWS